MNAVPSRWRRWAARLARHAVVPGASAPWADAMRRELDYIDDDLAALRWALGCVLACYRMRLTERLALRVRAGWRQAAACGALMLVIGLALQDRAGGQTEPPRPPVDVQACEPGNAPADVSTRSGSALSPDACNDRSKHEADQRAH